MKVFIFLLISVFSFCSAAEELLFEIDADADNSYGKPVIVNLLLRNNSNYPLLVPIVFSCIHTYSSFSIKGSSGKSPKFIGNVIDLIDSSTQEFRMHSKGYYVQPFNLSNCYEFERDEYEIYATYLVKPEDRKNRKSWSGVVKSNTLFIDLR